LFLPVGVLLKFNRERNLLLLYGVELSGFSSFSMFLPPWRITI
jgi:hypothetical protein